MSGPPPADPPVGMVPQVPRPEPVTEADWQRINGALIDILTRGGHPAAERVFEILNRERLPL